VAFAEKPEINVPPESEASSPEQTRPRSHRDRNRGYEASDDTDSTPDDQRRRSLRPAESSRGLDPSDTNGDNGRRRRHHHRRRSADPTSSSSSRSKEARTTSPAGSDATVDLPARFDEKGRKKPEAGEDPIADRIDEILQGRGATGKLFGNFVDGIFGPEGRKKGKDRERWEQTSVGIDRMRRFLGSMSFRHDEHQNRDIGTYEMDTTRNSKTRIMGTGIFGTFIFTYLKNWEIWIGIWGFNAWMDMGFLLRLWFWENWRKAEIMINDFLTIWEGRASWRSVLRDRLEELFFSSFEIMNWMTWWKKLVD
jgi:hypothetical protein